jgi:hypothetical protein
MRKWNKRKLDFLLEVLLISSLIIGINCDGKSGGEEGEEFN